LPTIKAIKRTAEETQMKPIYTFIRKTVVITGIACMALPFTQATAQEAGNESGANALEEITVTARRREEGLQDVPASVQAFGSQYLEAFQINDLADITARSPGVTLSQSGLTDTEIFMRGIGSDIQGAGADSPIGIFINGNYMPRNSGTLIDLYDLERVEVIKGPQSLRFGKNVVGGLINYVSKRPTEEFEGSVEATVGDYHRIDVAGSARGPISDTIRFGVSAVSRGHNPYATNWLDEGEEDIDRSTVRGELLFLVNDDLEISLSGDVTRLRGGSTWQDPAVTDDSYAVTYNSYFAPPIPDLPGFVLPNRNQPFVEGDERSGRKNFDGHSDADMWGINLNINYQTSNGLNFISTTDYRDTQIDTLSEDCGLYWNFPLKPVRGGLSIPVIDRIYSESVYSYLDEVPDCWFNQHKVDDVQSVSQEFRLSGGDGQTVDWSVGVYYLDEDINREEHVGFMFPDFSVITEYAFAMAYGGQPTGEDMTEGVSTAITQSSAKNLGAFGEFTWYFSEDWQLNGGLRYARDKKNFTVTRFGDSFDAPIEGGGFTVNDSDSWDAWLPSLTLSWAMTEDVSSYGSYNRGYKPGGFFGENAADPQAALNSFDPEFSNNFELGVKSMLAENSVRLNASAFYTDYKDLQTNQFVQIDPERPPDNFVVNAKDGTIAYGLEVDLTWRATDGLLLFANYAYTRCEFDGELIIDGDGTDIDGNTCRRTPKNAINLGFNWSAPISNGLEFFVGANFMYNDKYYFDNANTDEEIVPSQNMTDLRLGINAADGDWVLTGWAKNITNETNIVSVLYLFGTTYYKYAPPGTYGVTFRYNF
jgi:iron complex outermembrane receptor protein